MALIKSPSVTVVVGLVIHGLFFGAKFVAFLFSFLSLFFADAVDSFADGFVLLLLLVFLRFNLDGRLTLAAKEVLEASQWSAIVVFRVVLVLDAVNDLIKPAPRTHSLLVIIVAAVVLAGSLVLALLFVDEDDIVKSYIDPEELQRAKAVKTKKQKKRSCKVLPIFAEALDNLATSALTLLLGLFMYFRVAPDYLYIIDDGCNILVSLVMIFFAARGIWDISGRLQHASHQRLVNE